MWGVSFLHFECYFVLFTQQYAAAMQRCYLVVLDAQRIGEADALVAKLEVPEHLRFPIGFHGFWADR